eukprot:gb/GECH01014751.1/.p1 GENE.gb/GECH01014751.1/~~gb/GECH01014751.1/.p1  ORF type:complete len:301 (+),score=51.46 gb/GECH01014751.1/:1-903(+)
MATYNKKSTTIDPFSFHYKIPTLHDTILGLIQIPFIPLKFSITCVCVILTYIISFIVTKGGNDFSENNLVSSRNRVLLRLVRYLAKIALLASGVYSLNIKGKRANTPFSPKMVVSNHVSYLDILIYLSQDPHGFVAKESVKKVPFVGLCCMAFSCLFTRRKENAHGSSSSVSDSMKHRIHSLKGYEYPPLVVFPEATTTNNQSIINFKSGAFVPGLPIQPVILKYNSPMFDAGYVISSLYHIPLMLLQPWISIEVNYLPLYYPSRQELENPKLYAKNVRKLMSDASGLPLVDADAKQKYK